MILGSFQIGLGKAFKIDGTIYTPEKFWYPNLKCIGLPDVVPHLPTDHGEDEEHGHHAPSVLVQQELQVVPSKYIT